MDVLDFDAAIHSNTETQESIKKLMAQIDA